MIARIILYYIILYYIILYYINLDGDNLAEEGLVEGELQLLVPLGVHRAVPAAVRFNIYNIT